jgi:hypothetical protein
MERHGFTSFWLVLGVIVCLIIGYIYLFSQNFAMQALYVQGYRPSTDLLSLYGIFSVIGAVCYILLLCWKKIGFWLFIGVSIIQIPVSLKIGMNFGQILFGIISIAILWGILHIRKNGISTWDYMTKKNIIHTNNDSTNVSLDNSETRKCPFCAETIKSEANICRFCGKDVTVKWKCPKCNNENPNSTYECKKCGYKLI